MEKKKVKDTQKEDHYVEIAVGFKIIYNQNQYLAYTEIPKKKKDIRLEIYVGRVSLLKDQYLLFKCETDSERRQVFAYFKQVFSGEANAEIELVDFSMIDRMSIVSSDLFEEKMDQYPNFFTLPKKEDEIDASITLPGFLMKKSSKVKEQPEEIQFGGNGGVLESNVETPITSTETIAQNQVVEPIPQTSEVPITSNQNPGLVEPASDEQIEPVVKTPVIEQPIVTQTITNTAATQTPIETPMPVNPVPVEPTPMVEQPVTVEPAPLESIVSNVIPTEVLAPTIGQATPVVPNMPNIEQAQIVDSTINQNVTPTVMSAEVVPPVQNQTIVGIPPVEPTLNPTPEEPVKFEQIYDGKKRKKEKKKGKTSIVTLMIITLLLIASIAIFYIFVVEPKMNEQKPNQPNKPPVVEPEKPKTADLVCTLETENEEDNSLENKKITFVYDMTTKQIVTSKEHTTVTMREADMYMERKAMIKVFSQELKDTDGQKYTFKYDDKKYIYQVFIDRDYEKATEEEKDESWKSTFDEANEYYLNEGYTCNGKKKEEPSNERELTSTTGNNMVDYNNWIVTYQKAILSKDKSTLSITFEVKNNSSETRTLNGELKLYDNDKTNVRNIKLKNQINAGETSTITIDIESTNENKNPELGSLETIDLEIITQYLIELYR